MADRPRPPSVALLVEDDCDLSDLEVALIEETNLRPVVTASAEEALSYLEQNGAEVALLMADIRLPGTDGVQLAQTVSQRWPWVRLLVTSGNPGDRLRDLPASATYMPKPWRALEVLMEVERAVRQQATHQEPTGATRGHNDDHRDGSASPTTGEELR